MSRHGLKAPKKINPFPPLLFVILLLMFGMTIIKLVLLALEPVLIPLLLIGILASPFLYGAQNKRK